ncbi:MAG: twin-arginine translocase TatA/TatE family subunit [Bdellovibrionaceae bacterium]|nr:twin-arginine translocase TatA/TatE family subunit [Pseudobdellovibrionaceae bacterium]
MSLGPLELAVLVFVGLLFFGPKKLPELGRAFGETIRGFKKAMSDTDSKSTPNPPAKPVAPQTETQPADSQATTQKEKERV